SKRDWSSDVCSSDLETYEEQHQKQYEQLKKRIQSERPTERAKETYQTQYQNKKVDMERTKANEKEIEIGASLQKNLTKQGLAESIVIAEVLGLPQALKPYQNVAAQRKRQ